MPIDIKCPSCGSGLRVADEHAGRKTTCPSCQTIVDIPAANAPAPPTQPRAAASAFPPPNPTQPHASQSRAANVPQSPAANPYASTSAPVQTNTSGSAPLGVFQPLQDATFFIKFFAWILIVLGVIYCITIVGLIVGWLPLWMGLSLKRSAEALDASKHTGDPNALAAASSNLATFFKIVGVLSMIYVGFIALYLVIVVIAVIGGIAAGA